MLSKDTGKLRTVALEIFGGRQEKRESLATQGVPVASKIRPGSQSGPRGAGFRRRPQEKKKKTVRKLRQLTCKKKKKKKRPSEGGNETIFPHWGKREGRNHRNQDKSLRSIPSDPGVKQNGEKGGEVEGAISKEKKKPTP